MDTIENVTETETSSAPVNGTSSAPEVEAPKESPKKPWIEAGFKSRAEWRASKRGKAKATEKPAKKPAVKAAAKTEKVKKPAKKPKKLSAKSPKAEKTATRKADRKYKPQRTEPSALQKKLLAAFGGVGKVGELKAMGEKAFKNAPAKKRFSWARNNIRWLFANKFVSHVAPGEYKRLK